MQDKATMYLNNVKTLNTLSGEKKKKKKAKGQYARE